MLKESKSNTAMMVVHFAPCRASRDKGCELCFAFASVGGIHFLRGKRIQHGSDGSFNEA